MGGRRVACCRCWSWLRCGADRHFSLPSPSRCYCGQALPPEHVLERSSSWAVVSSSWVVMFLMSLFSPRPPCWCSSCLDVISSHSGLLHVSRRRGVVVVMRVSAAARLVVWLSFACCACDIEPECPPSLRLVVGSSPLR